ncbi:hypothetical protein I5U67_12390 [Stenotrophomonas maltophilia]|uniref:Uncharacterized protein n=1 Tax=Stenotrophomonas maltophilia TaxID=40324 RepID=A0A6B8IZV9_STEMA|nr:hypothetical protein [Stenotrophomonas maltophilia]MBH1652966.1 hypothetical protein [Stenotrophomonas maltophilia]QGM00223.1 hypothetical protein FEO89_05515 [Stenotrophomonas maltophilia]HDS1511131.1 hypothetical protein [Stenotrophomonas maltophilia]
MNEWFARFPITGKAVAEALESFAGPEDIWEVSAIETLTSADDVLLGDLWRRVVAGDRVFATREICSALARADQVVTLYARLIGNDNVHLYIDDGIAASDDGIQEGR